LKNMTHKEVIHYILEHIVHRSRFVVVSHQVCEFAKSLKIKLLSSSSYYAQANGQAESSNKTLIKLIKKKIEKNPK
jgi:hypothetical protein